MTHLQFLCWNIYRIVLVLLLSVENEVNFTSKETLLSLNKLYNGACGEYRNILRVQAISDSAYQTSSISVFLLNSSYSSFTAQIAKQKTDIREKCNNLPYFTLFHNNASLDWALSETMLHELTMMTFSTSLDSCYSLKFRCTFPILLSF